MRCKYGRVKSGPRKGRCRKHRVMRHHRRKHGKAYWKALRRKYKRICMKAARRQRGCESRYLQHEVNECATLRLAARRGAGIFG